VSTSGQAAMTEKEIPWWDANAVPLDPFGDDMALRAREEESSHAHIGSSTDAADNLASNNVSGLAAVGVGLPAERPRGGMRLVDPWSTDSMELGYSFPYMDPTTSTAAATSSDQHVRSDLLHVSAPGESEQSVILPDGARSRASTTSGRAMDGSLSSHSGTSLNLAGSSGSMAQSAGLVLGTTSILGGLAAPTQNAPIRRSDSWWSRFSRGSASGRTPRSPVPGGTPNVGGNMVDMEFRDPQPAPKLVPIKEGSGASGDGSVDRQGSGGSGATLGSHTSRAPSRRRPISVSSIGTGHTADSEAIERMGRMDVVQRGGTVSSVGTSESNADAIEDASLYPTRDDDLSVVMEGDIASGSSRSVLRSDVVQSPVAVDNYEPDSPLIRPPPYPTAEGYSSGNSSSATSGAGSGSRVSDRVRAYEEREAAHPRETRRSTYGLAPRASLYIANPEPKTSDDS